MCENPGCFSAEDSIGQGSCSTFNGCALPSVIAPAWQEATLCIDG